MERRVGDWAVVAAGAAIVLAADGTIDDAAIGLTAVGLDGTVAEAEAVLKGRAAAGGAVRRGRPHRRAGQPAIRRPARAGRLQTASRRRTHPPGPAHASARAARPGGTGATGSVTQAVHRKAEPMQVSMTVNGDQVTREIEPRVLLVHFIRENLGLTGTHWGCDTTNCGTCVVLMDGEPVKSCTVLAAMADGHEIRTVEGLASGGVLDPVQQGFMEEHGLQCGFCTPGMMLTARALLDKNPHPDDSRDPRGDLRPDVPVHRLRDHRPLGAVGGAPP